MGPPLPPYLGTTLCDLAFLLQAHVGGSAQQRRGGGYCSQSASTCQSSQSLGFFTRKRDRMAVSLVLTVPSRCALGLGSMAGDAPAPQPPSEPGFLSCAVGITCPLAACDLRASLLFPPSFLQLTLFSPLSSGTNLQVLFRPPHPYS